MVTALTGLAGISPWLVRNYRVHGEFVAIKSTFGYAFWQGNCALSEGTDKVSGSRSIASWSEAKAREPERPESHALGSAS